MQFRIYDRQTLAYKDGGYVASYTIDDDYIVNNNSTINIIKELNDKVVVGDTIVLIKTSGAYHKGTITTFDNADFKITYKADKELFNDNMLNPQATFFADENNKEATISKRFGIEEVATLLDSYFGKANDWLRKLPIKVVTDGDVLGIGVKLDLVEREKDKKKPIIEAFNKSKFEGKIKDASNDIIFTFNNNSWSYINKIEEIEETITFTNIEEYGITISGQLLDGDKVIASEIPIMLWTWKNDTINIVEWLTELFTSYNLSLSWWIDFNIAGEIKTELEKVVAIVNGKEEIIYKLAVDESKKIKVINERKPYYIVTLSAVTNGGKIIKDNVEMQTITYTEKKLPEATVCVVLDNESKKVYQLNSGINLLNPYVKEEDKFLTVEQGYESTKKDETSNVSGFIPLNIDNKLKDSNGKPVTKFILTCEDYDNKPRNITFYNKEKELMHFPNDVYYLSYSGLENDLRKVAFIIPLYDSNVSYCKICYDKDCKNLQFAKITEQIKENGVLKDVIPAFDGYNTPAIYYLCEHNGTYYVSLKPDEGITTENEDGTKRYQSLRVMPSKMTSATYDSTSENAEETTPQQVAEKTLIPSKFNQAIEIQISADSKMFDFENSQFGDLYKIINEHGTIDSNYTGRKEDSSSKWITLYFGLGRQNYTDLIQMRMRKSKYEVVYTK